MPDGLRSKVKSLVMKGPARVKTKPKDVSQKEWDSFAGARKRARKAAKRPHPFALAHEMLRRNEERRKAKSRILKEPTQHERTKE